MITNEEILELAGHYFEEDFVEFNEQGLEVINLITTKEELCNFAREIFQEGYNSGHTDGYYSWDSDERGSD